MVCSQIILNSVLELVGLNTTRKQSFPKTQVKGFSQEGVRWASAQDNKDDPCNHDDPKNEDKRKNEDDPENEDGP